MNPAAFGEFILCALLAIVTLHVWFFILLSKRYHRQKEEKR